MKIAHFSDLHLLALDGVPMRRFLNKRLTGWANLRLRRHAIHRENYVRAIAREIVRMRVDHVIVTGDLTNLSLESEFELARDVLTRELAIDPGRVTIVPGNHDVYTLGSFGSRRFERYLAPWLESDVPDLAIDVGGGRFPSVKLRDHIAILGISTAVPRPPFVAAGEIGRRQLEALRRALSHPQVRQRMVVLAIHHPAVHRYTATKQMLDGLRDAPALLSLLRPLTRGLVVHGHLHRRVQSTITTGAGQILHVGATSASLHHISPDRMAGFNIYDLRDERSKRVEAMVYDPVAQSFRRESIPAES